MKFISGDVVTDGNINMTVEKHENAVFCVWFDSSMQLHRATFYQGDLELLKRTT